jgi:hypothetical protein
LGGTASSPSPILNHGQCGIAFRHNSKKINHGAFEEGLDRIYRINRIIGIGWKAFGLNSSLPWDKWLNSILLILLILSKNPFEMGHARRCFFLQR